MIASNGKALKEFGDKLSGDKKPIEEALSELNTVSKDLELNDSSMKDKYRDFASEEMYKAQEKLEIILIF